MIFTQVTKDIYLFPDICNVYVIKSGELGLLIDLGTGDVLDHLSSRANDILNLLRLNGDSNDPRCIL